MQAWVTFTEFTLDFICKQWKFTAYKDLFKEGLIPVKGLRRVLILLYQKKLYIMFPLLLYVGINEVFKGFKCI